MKIFISYICFLLVICHGHTQTPYSGGSGDGYASSLLQLEPLATSAEAITEANIFPSPALAGAFFQIRSDKQIGEVVLYAVNGRRIAQLTEIIHHTYNVPDLPSGLYYLRIDIKNAGFQYSRIFISDL
ncbi:MAG: T9SS type A sorting domain-containing protein [Bacteroidetes bacterium]|nr:T9SS type A sorting domain-containing protein [Bacteroidota bacterium]